MAHWQSARQWTQESRVQTRPRPIDFKFIIGNYFYYRNLLLLLFYYYYYFIIIIIINIIIIIIIIMKCRDRTYVV